MKERAGYFRMTQTGKWRKKVGAVPAFKAARRESLKSGNSLSIGRLVGTLIAALLFLMVFVASLVGVLMQYQDAQPALLLSGIFLFVICGVLRVQTMRIH